MSQAKRKKVNRALDDARAKAVREFAVLILHGDTRHREWLQAAADAFVEGYEIPPWEKL